MSRTPAVEFRGVTKDFSIRMRGVKLRALDDLSFTVEAGEVFGLLGSNGSGKSTAIKIILGLIDPTAGGATVFGRSSKQVETRRLIGYLPEAPDFYRYLTGRELVTFYAELCGLRGTYLRGRTAEVIESVGLTAAADRLVGTYSKGMLQRIGLAQALVHDPQLLILDEPTAGVDPVGSAAITALIIRLKSAGKTILITSHLLAQIEDVCDRIAILDHGRLLLEGKVNELLRRSDPGQRTFSTNSLQPADLGELENWLAARGISLGNSEPASVRLEKIYCEEIEASRNRTVR